MVGGTGLNSDGFSSQTTWNATCLNADGNTVLNGSSACNGAGAGSPAPSFTGAYSLSNPFPNGVVPLIANPTGLANNLGNSLNTMLHSQRTPTTYNFNFGLEYELPHQVVLSAGYVGSRGLFLPLGSLDLNQLDLATIQKYNYSLCVDTSNPNCAMVANTWAPIQPATNAKLRLRDRAALGVAAAVSAVWKRQLRFRQWSASCTVIREAIQTTVRCRPKCRSGSRVTSLRWPSFTWAKLMTDDGNPPLGFVGTHLGAPQDARELYLEHSISPQDVKYQFTGTVSYDLPVGKGRAMDLNGVGDAVLGGWTGNLIAYFSTGVPIASPTVGARDRLLQSKARRHVQSGQAERRTMRPRGSTTTASRCRRVHLWPAAHLHISTTCARWAHRISIFRFTSISLLARRRIFGLRSPATTLAIVRNSGCRMCQA